MRRGRAGGIIRDEASALANQRADGSGLARRFGTSMPQASLPGVEAFGRAVMAQGETLMRFSGDWIAQRNAETAPIAQDPETGAWVRPSAPPIMGLRGMQIFNQVVDDRFQTAVQEDTRATLDRIAAENQFDPQRAHQLMTAHVEGTLGGLDDRWKNRLGPVFQREVSQRHRGILSSFYSRERTNAGKLYERMANDASEDIIAGALLNDPDMVADGLERARHSVGQLVDMQFITPEEGGMIMDEAARGGQGAMIIHNAAELLARGKADPQDFMDMATIIRVGQGSLKGVVGADIVRRFPSQTERDRLATALERLGRSAEDRQAASATELRAHQVNQNVDRNRGTVLPGQTDDDDMNAVTMWLAETMSIDIGGIGVDHRSLDAINVIVDRYGRFPKPQIDAWFSNSRRKTLEDLTISRQRFERLRDLNQDDKLSDREHTFMSLYTEAARLYGDTPQALERVEQRMNAALRDGDSIRREWRRDLMDLFKGSSDQQFQNFGDLAHDLNNKFQAATIGWAAWVPFTAKPTWNALTLEDQRAIAVNIATKARALNHVDPGSAYDDAAKYVLGRFAEDFRPDPMHPRAQNPDGGIPLVRTARAVPVLPNPLVGRGSEPYAEHIEDVVRRIVAPNEEEAAAYFGNEPFIDPSLAALLPEDASLGNGLALSHAGLEDEGVFQLRVVAEGFPDGIPLTDVNGNDILIDVGYLNRVQEVEFRGFQADAGRERMEWEKAQREYDERVANFFDTREDPLGEFNLDPSPESPLFGRNILDVYEPPIPLGAFDMERVLRRSPTSASPDGMAPSVRIQATGAGAPTPPPRQLPDDGSISIFDAPDPVPEPGEQTIYRKWSPSVTRFLESQRNGNHHNVRDLDRDFQVRLANFFKAMPEGVREILSIGSAVRSRAEQQALVDNPAFAASSPDRSKHVTGHAVDLNGFMANPGPRRWAEQNAARFGLHFPYKNMHVEPIPGWRPSHPVDPPPPPPRNAPFMNLVSDSWEPNDGDESLSLEMINGDPPYPP